MSEEKFNFVISQSAQNRLAFLLLKEEAGTNFRVSVNGGGCSGFQYDMKFDKSLSDEDLVFNAGDIKVVIDNISMNFLNNCQLNFVETLGSSMFEIKNPNATAKCGCGNSFAV